VNSQRGEVEEERLRWIVLADELHRFVANERGVVTLFFQKFTVALPVMTPLRFLVK